jgi:uncharacterized membrane protein HdeD (DUF308 family)
MLQSLGSRWWVFLLRGVVAIAAGIIAIEIPGIALLSLVMLFSAFAIVDGIACLVIGFKGESDGTVWWTMVALGALAIIAGIGAFAYPKITLAVLLGIVAATAIMRGVFEVAAAIRLRKVIDDEWVLGISGALSVLFGALLLARPVVGLAVLAMLMGCFMIAVGAMQIVLSLRLRKVHSRLSSGAPAQAA